MSHPKMLQGTCRIDGFELGDLARVKQKKGKLGPTIWEITYLDPDSPACLVREHGTNYAEQRFDTSLLQKVAK